MVDIFTKVTQHLAKARPTNLPTPCAEVDIDEMERVIGFGLPKLLRACLQQLGNGGYGPGYGIIGIGRCGHQSDYGDLVALYETLKIGLEGPVAWPNRLLAFCDWGSNIYSCVECDDGASIWLYRNNRIKKQPFSLPGFFEDWIRHDTDKYVDWGTVRKQTVLRNPATGKQEVVTYRVLE